MSLTISVSSFQNKEQPAENRVPFGRTKHSTLLFFVGARYIVPLRCSLFSQGLKLLKRLLTISAVGDRAAEGRAEGRIEGCMSRAAVGAFRRLKQRDHHAGWRTRRGDTCFGQLLPPSLANPIASPAMLPGYVDLYCQAIL